MSREKRTYRLCSPEGVILEMTTKHCASWVYQFAKKHNPDDFGHIGIFKTAEQQFVPVENRVLIWEV